MSAPDTLARAFEAIDDPQERLRNLTSLVDALSPWERRLARLHLGDNDGLAGFEDLPADVICILVRHLCMEDVLACASVSRRCRTTWTEPAVAASLSRHFFPVLTPPFSFSSFRKACRKYLRRRAGIFTDRIEMCLPTDGSTPERLRQMEEWERNLHTTLRPDPLAHPEGRYPRHWLHDLLVHFACFGGGNIVWYASFWLFVVDNMYTRTRKVVDVHDDYDDHESDDDASGWIGPPDGHSAASASLVVLQPHAPYRIVVYDIETNKSLEFRLPSNLIRMVVRERRIFIVLAEMQIVVLDHDGTRLLTKFHFAADKDLEKDCPQFRTTSREGILVYPHPHLEDRFFIAICGEMDMEPLPEDVASPEGTESKGHARVESRIVREFHGDSPVAVYHSTHEPHSGELAPPAPAVDPQDSSDYDPRKGFTIARDIRALDGQGSFATGSWSVGAPGMRVLDAAGLPFHPDEDAYSTVQESFNVMTKEFSVQRHLDPRTGQQHVKYAPPWQQQRLIPWIPRPGVVRLRWLDAHEADFMPTRTPGPETGGWGDGWMVSVVGLEEHMLDCLRVYQDEHFILLHVWHNDQFYLWSFVEDGDGEGGGESQ